MTQLLAVVLLLGAFALLIGGGIAFFLSLSALRRIGELERRMAALEQRQAQAALPRAVVAPAAAPPRSAPDPHAPAASSESAFGAGLREPALGVAIAAARHASRPERWPSERTTAATPPLVAAPAAATSPTVAASSPEPTSASAHVGSAFEDALATPARGIPADETSPTAAIPSAWASPAALASPGALASPAARVPESPTEPAVPLLPDALPPGAPAARASAVLPSPAAVSAGEPHTESPPQRPPQSTAPAAAEHGGLERWIGQRGLAIAGVIVVFLAAAFFLKYAYDQDWLGRVLGPRVRLLLIAAGALGLAVAGFRLLPRMRVLAESLLAAGLGVGYLTVYAGLKPDLGVVPAPILNGVVAFVLCAAITAAGMIFAVRRDLLPLAFGALLGGFATPALLSTGGGQRDALFAYLLLLVLGVLAAALWRSRHRPMSSRAWRLLDALACAGSGCYLIAWQLRSPARGEDVATLLLWLLAFHVALLGIAFAESWRRRAMISVARFSIGLANLALSLALAGMVLGRGTSFSLICLGGAVAYLALGLWSQRRCQGYAAHGFIVLASVQLTLGLLYLTPVDHVATAWACEALALLWLSWHFVHRPTRLVALALLALVFARTAFIQLALRPLDLALGFNAWFPTLLVPGIACALAAVIQRFWMRRASQADATLSQDSVRSPMMATSLAELLAEIDRRCARVAGHLAGLLIAAAIACELERHAQGHAAAWSGLPVLCALAALGGVTAALYALVGWLRRQQVTVLTGLVPMGLGLVLGMAAYADAVPVRGLPGLNLRCLGAAAAIAACVLIIALLPRVMRVDRRSLRSLIVVACASTLLLATLETCVVEDPHAAAGTLARQLCAVWLALGVAGAVLAAWLRSGLIAGAAVLAVAAGTITALLLYGLEGAPAAPVANPRALLLLAGVGAIAALALVVRRLVAGDTAERLAAAATSTAIAVFALGVLCEAIACTARHHAAQAVWWTALVWALLATVLVGPLRRARGLAITGLVVLCLAAPLGLIGYAAPGAMLLPVLNLHALPAALVVAGGVVIAWLAHRDARSGLVRTRGRCIAWLTIGYGFLWLTLDPPLWALREVQPDDTAQRVATFSITAMWLLLAATGLALGFRYRLRVARWLALGLFGLTALKLLLVDLSGTQQLWRILAFLITGLVLIAASYAYYRLERRLAQRDASAPPDEGC